MPPIHFINEVAYKQIQMRLFPCAILFAHQVNIHISGVDRALGAERFGASGQPGSSVAGYSQKLEIMYIVDDSLTTLAFVYLCAYSTDVCGMLIAVLRRVRIEQHHASYAGIIHSAPFTFSPEQFTEHVSVSVS